MTVTVDDLLDQLSEDDDRKPQLKIYFDTATAYVKNAVSSDTVDRFEQVSKAYLGGRQALQGVT
ncbi:hypothetical protein Q6294_32785, partial [Klebsiella pneumoniae]